MALFHFKNRPSPFYPGLSHQALYQSWASFHTPEVMPDGHFDAGQSDSCDQSLDLEEVNTWFSQSRIAKRERLVRKP